MFQLALLALAALTLFAGTWGYLRTKRDQADMRELRRLQKARLLRHGPAKDNVQGNHRLHVQRKRRYGEVRMVPPDEAFSKPGSPKGSTGQRQP